MVQSIRETGIYRHIFGLFAQFYGDATPAIIQRLAQDDIFLLWQDIGITEPMRSSRNIFKELTGNNQAIAQLEAQDKLNPFKQRPIDTYFVVQSAEKKLIELWRQQLNSFAKALVA
jgi:hypothetical protein